MPNSAAKELLLRALDQAGGMPGPFWEIDPRDRRKVSELLGSTIEFSVPASGVTSGGTAPEISGQYFMALMLLMEFAIEARIDAEPGNTRHEAITHFRDRHEGMMPR